jgi:hypothetical protein
LQPEHRLCNSAVTAAASIRGYAFCVRRALNNHMAALAVLLCLQAAACMLAVRRDPVDRFRAACVSGLVWTALRRLDSRPPMLRRSA